jgi:hypothetical protein
MLLTTSPVRANTVVASLAVPYLTARFQIRHVSSAAQGCGVIKGPSSQLLHCIVRFNPGAVLEGSVFEQKVISLDGITNTAGYSWPNYT